MIAHYGVPPSEYWQLTIAEIELIHDAKRSKMVGNMHEDDYKRLVDRREALEKTGVRVL